MGIKRTRASLEEEYDAVRKAYLAALKQQNYSTSTGTGSRSVTRADVNVLRSHMLELERELGQMDNGGIRVVGAVPND